MEEREQKVPGRSRTNISWKVWSIWRAGTFLWTSFSLSVKWGDLVSSSLKPYHTLLFQDSAFVFLTSASHIPIFGVKKKKSIVWTSPLFYKNNTVKLWYEQCTDIYLLSAVSFWKTLKTWRLRLLLTGMITLLSTSDSPIGIKTAGASIFTELYKG